MKNVPPEDAVTIFNQLSKSDRELVAHVLIKAHLEDALMLVRPLLAQKQKRMELSRVMSYRAVREGFAFSLQNGLRARLYRLDSPRVDQVAKIISSTSSAFQVNQTARSHYHLVKVAVAGQNIYLLKGYVNRLAWHTLLTKNLTMALTNSDALIYGKKVYSEYQETAKLLQQAILQKTNLPITSVLFSERGDQDD